MSLLIYIDCEGTPVQEFSAIYVNKATSEIVDVFHRLVKYPFPYDYDYFARKHVHGLDINFLSRYGMDSEEALVSSLPSL